MVNFEVCSLLWSANGTERRVVQSALCELFVRRMHAARLPMISLSFHPFESSPNTFEMCYRSFPSPF